MANDEHLERFLYRSEGWNAWRAEYPHVRPELSDIDLRGRSISGFNLASADLSRAQLQGSYFDRVDLRGANLGEVQARKATFANVNLEKTSFRGADLVWAIFRDANLQGAALTNVDLWGARLSDVDLRHANLDDARLGDLRISNVNLAGASLIRAGLNGVNLSDTDLTGANLTEASLGRTNLSGARLSQAILRGANLVDSDLSGADITGCSVYGISAWDVNLQGASQTNLVLSRPGESVVTVDNLELAQFIFLLLNNQEIRNVIDTITSKVVLILGRFTSARKTVLDAIRQELRKDAYGYVPIVFDFDRPASRDLHETVTLLARMSRFIIADITNAKSIPQELTAVVKDLPSVPVQPILRKGSKPWAMFEHIQRYPWVLPVIPYLSKKDLLDNMREKVIEPAESMAQEQRPGN